MTKLKKISLIAITVLLISLTVLGSFRDYEISKALYIGEYPSENFFGILFAFIGIIPTFVGWCFLGAGILRLSKNQIEDKRKRRLYIALAILLFVLSFFFFCNTLTMVNAAAFSVHFAIAYPIGIAVLALAFLAGYKMAERSQNKALLNTLIFLSVLSIICMIIIMVTKGIMERPRFRWVMEFGEADGYKEWWERGGALKDAADVSATSDDFASFPSGHSAYSMFALFLFPALADFSLKLEKYKPLLACLGFVWWALTALSRITVGAHFLSDVCIGALITVFSYLATMLLKSKLKSKP